MLFISIYLIGFVIAFIMMYIHDFTKSSRITLQEIKTILGFSLFSWITVLILIAVIIENKLQEE